MAYGLWASPRTYALKEMIQLMWDKRASCAHRYFAVIVDTGGGNDLGSPKQKTKGQAK